MSKEKLLSIIIPVYNVEKYLHRCVDSVINQSYTNLEIILIDDGSIDNSGKICDEYVTKDSRIKVFHSSNKGVSNARNIGLEKASGDYVTFVDSDDSLNLEIYANMMAVLIDNNSIDVACFDVCDYYLETKEIKKCNLWEDSNIISDQNGLFVDFFKRNAWVWNKVFKAEIAKSSTFDSDVRYGEDGLYILSLLVKDAIHIVYSSSSVGYYRTIREESLTSSAINLSYLNFLETSKKIYYILKDIGYGWIGAYRIQIAVYKIVGNIPVNKFSSYKVYMKECQIALRSIDYEDLKNYFIKDNVSWRGRRSLKRLRNNTLLWVFERKMRYYLSYKTR